MPHDEDKTVSETKRAPAEEVSVRYVVSELLRGGREAILEHNGSEYHLRITANGRLILTK
jgi:hemin uptake protein HemP